MGQTIGHYEVLEKLGEGGMGAVYKARDTRLDRYVALKTVPAALRGDEGRRRRFILEAKAASALNHPNIVTVYDITEWQGADYIAMEYIEGHTLRSLVAETAAVGSVLPVMRQLAEALTAAHGAGIVHRDIKPDNVMVRADGYVKVLDFGIARLPHAEDLEDRDTAHSRAGVIMGTRRYMSPEQARGEAVESASDVFSLGLVFYELATGSHPFHAAESAASMNAMLFDSPTPPTRVNPEVPAALGDLILRMLSKEAVLRPTAADVRSELARLGGAPGMAAPTERPAPAPRLAVGRDREREQLQAAFSATATSGWTLLCVSGEPGLGKTTLVEDFLHGLRARRDTAWIARGRCSERLGGTDALLPILEGLESLVRGESGDQAARILKRFAPTWYLQVAPSMGTATETALAEQAKTASQERMKRELHAFLEEMCRVRPLVLFFDDMHWADISTCDLVSYLGARCRELPILAVATYRPSELLGAKHPFLQVKVQLQARGAARDLPLEFLTREDLERLVALKFPDHHFPGDFIALIHAKTEGNPLFIVDLLHYLRDRGVLVQQEGRWALTGPASEIEKEVPATIRSMIQVTIDRLAESDRRLLLAAAVQGVQFDSAVLAQAVAVDPVEVEERLLELDVVHELVRSAGEQEYPDRTLTVRYRFVHVFYQDALYGSLTPSRRAAMSARIANAIVGFSGDKARAQAAELAFLFESARDFAKAAPFFLQAARNAARVFAHPEAAVLARKGLRALETLPDSDDRAKLELQLSLTLGVALMATKGYAAPEVERTHLRSRELARRLGDARRLFPVLWGLFSFYVIGAQLQKALEVAEEMLPSAEGSSDPTVKVEALHAMGTTLGFMGRFAEAREYLERIPKVFDLSHQPFHASIYVLDPGVSSLAMLGRFLVVMGYPDQALQHLEGAVERARRLVHPQSVAYATFFLSWVRHDRGEVPAALETAELAMALSREHGLHQILEWARIVKGWALCAQGKATEGVEDVRRSLAAQLRMGAKLERPYCLGLLARGLAQTGAYDEALATLDEALAIIEVNEERCYEAEIHRLRGEVLRSRGLEHQDPALLTAAAEALEKAVLLARRAAARLLELRAAASRLRLAQEQGDDRGARADLGAVYEWFTEGSETPTLLEARALLGISSGKPP